jgi:endonuclease-3
MLARLIDELERAYGPLTSVAPAEPYAALVWLNCGYPASDEACARGFAALTARFDIAPEALLAADAAALAETLQAGGMIPDIRAQRLKQIAALADGLDAVLAGPLPEARKALTRFPTIGEAAADRILLFAGIAPLAVVPAGGLQVPLRLGYGAEAKDWGRTYRSVRDALAAELPPDFPTRQRAYLLLKAHGQAICKRSAPRCERCPLTADCRYFQMVVAPAALSRG